MIEFLYNACYGGFSFSEEFEEEFCKRFPEKAEFLKNLWNLEIRYDPDVVALWKEMGERANGPCSKIKSKMLPEKCIEYVDLDEYDGMESVGIDWNYAYRVICDALVEAVKNKHDTTQLLHEYDEMKDTYRQYLSSK